MTKSILVKSFGPAFLIFASVFSSFAQLAPQVQSWTTAVGSSGNALLNQPAGTQPGDLMIASIALEKGHDATITPPSGWTLIRRTDNSTDAGLGTYYKLAAASDPSQFLFSLTGQKWAAGITRITGADPLNPIQASSGGIGGAVNVTAPSLTTTSANALVLAYFTNKKGTTYTAPLGTAEIYDAPNLAGDQPSHMLAVFSQVISGTTGNLVAIPRERDSFAAQQIAITANPAGVNHGLLTIVPSPAAGYEVTFQGLPGRIYTVQYTDELLDAGTVWTDLPNHVTDVTGRVIVEDTTAASARFYRATLIP